MRASWMGDAGRRNHGEPCSRVVDREGTRLFCRPMRHTLHPRSRVFRSLLVLALLAWTALAFNAFAQPPALIDSEAAMQTAIAADGAAAMPCDGMMMEHAFASVHPAPLPPAGHGHGCCQHGGCWCASFCNGIVGVPRLDMAWAPLHAPVLVPLRVVPMLAPTAPLLRPPIA